MNDLNAIWGTILGVMAAIFITYKFTLSTIILDVKEKILSFQGNLDEYLLDFNNKIDSVKDEEDTQENVVTSYMVLWEIFVRYFKEIYFKCFGDYFYNEMLLSSHNNIYQIHTRLILEFKKKSCHINLKNFLLEISNPSIHNKVSSLFENLNNSNNKREQFEKLNKKANKYLFLVFVVIILAILSVFLSIHSLYYASHALTTFTIILFFTMTIYFLENDIFGIRRKSILKKISIYFGLITFSSALIYFILIINPNKNEIFNNIQKVKIVNEFQHNNSNNMRSNPFVGKAVNDSVNCTKNKTKNINPIDTKKVEKRNKDKSISKSDSFNKPLKLYKK